MGRRTKTLALLLIFAAIIAAIFQPLPLNAQPLTELTGSSEEHPSSVTVNPENIDKLVKTLEDEQSRKDFIDNLKTLKQIEQSDEEKQSEMVVSPLSKTLGVDNTVGSFIQQYRQILSDNNLSTSIIGKIFLTAILLFVTALLSLSVKKASLAFQRYLLKVRSRFYLSYNRFLFYSKIIRYFNYFLLFLLFLYTLSVLWGVSAFLFWNTDITTDLLGKAVNVLLVIVVAIITWETINASIEIGMRNATNDSARRLRTLLPLVRNVIFVVFVVLFSLVLLSEIGINIMPLVAGAGIFGIAIGFGAQTMVKDFLTGFTIILEDLIQVGDVAGVGGKIGFVERITIRKVQLRDLDGRVYTVPFSEITIVENLTKDFSYYLMDVGVAYRESTDEVVEYLRQIDEQMRKEEKFRDLILEPIEILGVDNFADSAVIIKARIKTLPIKQWEVGREFNRRMKIKFDEMGIEIPFPHQTVYFGEDKKGKAPSAHIEINKGNKE